jgi:hypothetical protein
VLGVAFIGGNVGFGPWDRLFERRDVTIFRFSGVLMMLFVLVQIAIVARCRCGRASDRVDPADRLAVRGRRVVLHARMPISFESMGLPAYSGAKRGQALCRRPPGERRLPVHCIVAFSWRNHVGSTTRPLEAEASAGRGVATRSPGTGRSEGSRFGKKGT